MTEPSSQAPSSGGPPKRRFYGKTVKLSAIWTFGSNVSSRVVAR